MESTDNDTHMTEGNEEVKPDAAAAEEAEQEDTTTVAPAETEEAK